MSRFLKVPSPATVIATLALFVSLGGTAWAVKQIGTNQIKNNAVTTSKIGNKAVTPAKSSMMWALVAADGTLIQSSPGVSSSLGGNPSGPAVQPGYYFVFFPKSITGKSIQVTPKAPEGALNLSDVAVSQCGHEGYETSDPVRINCGGPNTENQVVVETFNPPGQAVEQAFYITVW